MPPPESVRISTRRRAWRGSWASASRVTSMCSLAVLSGSRSALPLRWPAGRGDRVAADRLAQPFEPLFPFLRALRFPVCVQQQAITAWATSLLRLEQPEEERAQWRSDSPSPSGPVTGQGAVVERRTACDQAVPDNRCPGELDQVAAAVAVAEHPAVPPGVVKRAEYWAMAQRFDLFGCARSAHL